MAKGRSGANAQRAMQQRISAGMFIVTQAGAISAPSKADLRASIPAYDESMVKRVEAAPKKKPKR